MYGNSVRTNSIAVERTTDKHVLITITVLCSAHCWSCVLGGLCFVFWRDHTRLVKMCGTDTIYLLVHFTPECQEGKGETAWYEQNIEDQKLHTHRDTILFFEWQYWLN